MNLSHAIPTVVKYEPTTELRTPTHGARAFASIMRVYACAVGPRAGWTKFRDDDKREIINRHLVDDGRRAISRATFYRWKSEAKEAGLLAFTSTASRPGDRNQAKGGWWMKVLTVPATGQVQGRRPRLLHETFATPPPDETFATCTKEEDLRDPSPQRDQKKEAKAGDEPKNCSPPTAPQIQFSDNTIRIEKRITEKAKIASTHLEHPWKPEEQRRTDRLKAIENTLAEYGEEEMLHLAIGQVIQRSREIEYARQSGLWQGFWEVNHADPVCRMFTYDREGNEDRIFQMMETGARWLGNHHRQREIEREAIAGVRGGTSIFDDEPSSDSHDHSDHSDPESQNQEQEPDPHNSGRLFRNLGEMAEWLRVVLLVDAEEPTEAEPTEPAEETSTEETTSTISTIAIPAEAEPADETTEQLELEEITKPAEEIAEPPVEQDEQMSLDEFRKKHPESIEGIRRLAPYLAGARR